jgi:nucleoside-diphosphate-sugar epimerase
MIKYQLITGKSGFLGKIISSRLAVIYPGLKSIGRTNLDEYKYDLISDIPIDLDLNFDLIIHCAGKAHLVPKTAKEQQDFFDVNVKGTQNLLIAIEKLPILPKSFVLISTVAVYGKETGQLINEGSGLFAKDAYGMSKIQAEKIIWDWCTKNGVICTILRLPLIAGPKPPGNLGAMINGIAKGRYFNIAGGFAKKSIVLADDVAAIIPKASKIGGIYNLTDGLHPSFSELSINIASQLKKAKPSNIPLWLAFIMAIIGDFFGKNAPINTNKLKKITSNLTFDDSLAREKLGWNPTPVLKGFKI